MSVSRISEAATFSHKEEREKKRKNQQQREELTRLKAFRAVACFHVPFILSLKLAETFTREAGRKESLRITRYTYYVVCLFLPIFLSNWHQSPLRQTVHALFFTNVLLSVTFYRVQSVVELCIRGKWLEGSLINAFTLILYLTKNVCFTFGTYVLPLKVFF